jgi:hypothetical protein
MVGSLRLSTLINAKERLSRAFIILNVIPQLQGTLSFE